MERDIANLRPSRKETIEIFQGPNQILRNVAARTALKGQFLPYANLLSL